MAVSAERKEGLPKLREILRRQRDDADISVTGFIINTHRSSIKCKNVHRKAIIYLIIGSIFPFRRN